MRKFFVSKKTGFRNITPYNPVIIRDWRGVIFYTTEGIEPVNEFNLPKGDYLIQAGAFSPLERPVDYPLIKLPKPERTDYPNPFNFKFKFGVNKNKCSIVWERKYILFDTSLLEKPLYVLDFILFHEYSHHKYATEKYADICAANYMKQVGYNPSQIGYAPMDSLSEFADSRKEFMVQKLVKHRRK